MIVKRIDVKGDKVNVMLAEGKNFEISLQTYINNTLLIDSEIDEKRINHLKSQDNYFSVKQALLSKLNKKRLSKKECAKFLMDNGLDSDQVEKILEEMISNFLINDAELAELIIQKELFNRKGINLIKEKLFNRLIEGDYKEYLSMFVDKERYEKNIKLQLEKYYKLSRNKSSIETRMYLINKMVDNGYNKEEFECFLSDFVVDEYGAINREVEKFFKNREVNRENIDKIAKKLLSKRFNYAIIKDVIREWSQNEIN